MSEEKELDRLDQTIEFTKDNVITDCLGAMTIEKYQSYIKKVLLPCLEELREIKFQKGFECNLEDLNQNPK